MKRQIPGQEPEDLRVLVLFFSLEGIVHAPGRVLEPGLGTALRARLDRGEPDVAELQL